MKKIFLIVITVFLLTGYSFSQEINFNNKIISLKNNILKADVHNNNVSLLKDETKRSPGISFILSLILPGAGHFYTGRMDVGQYFFASEVALWLGFAGMTVYGNNLKNDAQSYAVVHSGLDKNSKDDNYFVNVASFNSIYEYNNYRLTRGEYDQIYYDINQNFWNWDDQNNRYTFDDSRKKSEQMMNSRIIFVSGMIVNRVASALSSLILTKKANETTSITPEFTYDNKLNIDGLKLNIKFNF